MSLDLSLLKGYVFIRGDRIVVLATLANHVHMHGACTCGCCLSNWLKIFGNQQDDFKAQEKLTKLH